MTPTELAQLRIDDAITQKQYDVLLLRSRGLSQHQIAMSLRLARETVRHHERAGLRNIDKHRRTNADNQPSASAA